MKFFTKKETIILNSELQRDDFIEKLDSAHVAYDVYPHISCNIICPYSNIILDEIYGIMSIPAATASHPYSG